MHGLFPLLGRIFLSLIFLMAAVNQIVNFAGTQQYMASFGMPATGFLLICAILLELSGSVLLILGYRLRWGVALLILFLIPATLIFHTKFSDPFQIIQFEKNLAILGGLLVLYGFGPGNLSLGSRQKSPQL